MKYIVMLVMGLLLIGCCTPQPTVRTEIVTRPVPLPYIQDSVRLWQPPDAGIGSDYGWYYGETIDTSGTHIKVKVNVPAKKAYVAVKQQPIYITDTVYSITPAPVIVNEEKHTTMTFIGYLALGLLIGLVVSLVAYFIIKR
jgi:hypothetical protein